MLPANRQITCTRSSVLRAVFFTLALLNARTEVWAQSPSTTTISVSSSSVQWPQPVILTAAVSSGHGPVTPGQVAFCLATAKSCAGSALLGQAQLISGGTANFETVLGPGTYSIKAVFKGTSVAAASASSALTLTVGGRSLTGTAISATGQAGNYSLTSTVSGNGGSAPSGTVSFVDNGNGVVIGQAALKPGSGAMNFVAEVFANAGSEPSALATGDFNGDGTPDIVVANVNANGNGEYTLELFLSNGTGTYSPPVTLVLPDFAGGVGGLVTGDFNNDGNLDIAVSGAPNVLDILLGDGHGDFGASSQFLPTPYDPNALAAGDFNHDGNEDLAFTDQFAGTVTVMLGNGQGSFSAAAGSASATGTFPYGIGVGDFNGDGKPDLAIPNYFSNTVTILLGNGDGTFTPGNTVNTDVYPDAIAVADLNGDGKADLAVTNQYSQTVNVLLGNGAGGFAAPGGSGYQAPATGQDPVSIAAADFNGDGIPDLAVGSSGSSEVTIFVGKGDGTFPTSINQPTGGSIGEILAVDVTGDGRPDVVVSDSGANAVSVLVNTSFAAATATIPNVAVPGSGLQNVSASYSGSANYSPSTSGAIGLNGTPIASAVTLTIDPGSNVAANQPVQLTAVVTSSLSELSPNGGTVIFYNGSTQIGSATVSGNSAVINYAFPTVGVQKVFAVFEGGGGLVSSTSGTVQISSALQVVTTTALSVSSNSVASGVPVNLTATVMAAGKPVTRGLIRFCNSGPSFCEGSALLGNAQLTANGTASLKVRLPIGTTNIQATFAGTAEELASTSTKQAITVTGSLGTATTVAISGSTGNYSLSATVTGHGPVLSGNVLFVDTSSESHVIGTAGMVQQNSFVQSSSTPFGNFPDNIATADFNADGNPDVVSANGSSLQVLPGKGDGTFGTPILISGTYYFFAIADLNGDGKPDIAAVNASTLAVDILLGNGDGTFSKRSSLALSSRSYGIAIADFNRDGIPDVAVGNANAGSITVLIGNGDGTFAVDPASPAAASPTAMVAADFNGDGNPDLAVIDSNGSLNILLGSGDGNFQASNGAIPLGDYPGSIALADFNEDGKADLVVVNVASGNVSILLGNGDGTFNSSLQSTPYENPGALAVGDLNGDGRSDFVLSDGLTNGSTIYFSNGDGTFYTQSFSGMTNAGGVVLPDLNGDGSPDLVFTQHTAGNVIGFLSTSFLTSTLNNVQVYGPGTHLLAATYTGGAPYATSTSNTVAAAGSPIPTATVLSAPTAGSAGESVQFTATVLPLYPFNNLAPTGTVSLYSSTGGEYPVQAGTLVNNRVVFTVKLPATGSLSYGAVYNGDANYVASFSTLATVNVEAASTTTLSISSESVTAGTPVVLTATVTSGGKPVTQGQVTFCNAAVKFCEDSAIVGTAHLNGSGGAILRFVPGIGGHSYTAVFKATALVLGSASTVQNLTVKGLYPTTTVLTSSVVSGKYTLQAAVSGSSVHNPGGNVTFVNLTDNEAVGTAALSGGTTTLSFGAAGSPAAGSQPYVISSADFNGDGKVDLAVGNDGSNTVSILLGNGNGTFTLKSTVAVGNYPSAMVVADFDGNGIPDLAIANELSRSVTVLLGKGDGTFIAAPAILSPQGTYGVAAVDLNGDGRIDLAVTTVSGESVQVFLGNGDGTFQMQQPTPIAGYMTGEVIAADFNGDGRQDLAVAVEGSSGGGGVAILLGDGDGTLTYTGTLTLSNYPVITIGDFNRDGKPDIVAVIPGTVFMFPGMGDGGFGTPVMEALGSSGFPDDVETADFNGDGIQDLAVTLYNGGVTVLLGGGNGSFNSLPTTIAAGPTPGLLAVGDFNGDGKTDFATANYGSNNVSVLLNTLMTTTRATLSGITLAGTGNESIQAQFPTNQTYSGSVSNVLSLAPNP